MKRWGTRRCYLYSMGTFNPSLLPTLCFIIFSSFFFIFFSSIRFTTSCNNVQINLQPAASSSMLYICLHCAVFFFLSPSVPPFIFLLRVYTLDNSIEKKKKIDSICQWREVDSGATNQIRISLFLFCPFFLLHFYYCWTLATGRVKFSQPTFAFFFFFSLFTTTQSLVHYYKSFVEENICTTKPSSFSNTSLNVRHLEHA